jgi:hypothetical protein
MALRITHDPMTLETGNRVVATAWFSGHAAAGGIGAWIEERQRSRAASPARAGDRPATGARAAR